MVKITPTQIPTTTQKLSSQKNFSSPQWADIPGLPTGIENMGRLDLIHRGVWGVRGVGRGGKMLLKNICEGVHMLVK